MSVTDAVFAQAAEEETDPRNVVMAGNVRYTAPKAATGYRSMQGSVAHLFETTAPDVKQAGYLRDETGEVKFTIWEQSAWEETKSTPDPTDTTGHMLIAHYVFPDLVEGDVVRFETVRKSWFKREAQLETRRNSAVTSLSRRQPELSSVRLRQMVLCRITVHARPPRRVRATRRRPRRLPTGGELNPGCSR